MKRILIAAGTGLALVGLSAGAVGAARSTPSSAAGPTWVVSKQAPRAGTTFVGVVIYYPDEWRATVEETHLECMGELFTKKGKPIRGVALTETSLPEDASVPTARVLTFRVPRKSAGKRLGFGCSGTTWFAPTADGTRMVQHADGGVMPVWRIGRG